MVLTDDDLEAFDSRNAMVDQISRAGKVQFQTISGAADLQKEIGTNAYILHQLFGANSPLTLAFISELISFINNNFASFERQVNSTTCCMAFTYNLSRVEAGY